MRGLGRYVREFFTNWKEYDAPVPEKLRLTVVNRSRTVKRIVLEGKGCCGHYGEPGC
ncbi:MAG TPA: hypothetical protein VGA70_04945 [Longimicrobiales bacterium]|jgi:hypothetical protein